MRINATRQHKKGSGVSGRGLLWMALAVSVSFNLMALEYRWVHPSLVSLERSEELNSKVELTTTIPFRGHKARQFSGERLTPSSPSHSPTLQEPACHQWSVIVAATATHTPSLAVQRAASLRDWCLVVVTDKPTLSHYVDVLRQNATTSTGTSTANIRVLSLQEILANEPSSSILGQFARVLPKGHMAMKNLGYLFAMQQGAKYILDLEDDDDTVLQKDAMGGIMSPLVSVANNKINNNLQYLKAAQVVAIGNTQVFNPYPLLTKGASASWPRGFPVSRMHDNTTHGFVAYTATSDSTPEDPAIRVDKLAVLQILVGKPDTDALHNLLDPSEPEFQPQAPLMVPTHHVFAPYNAQSTLHTTQALWALLLPVTVPERVSDILRGYVAQTLFRALDLHIGFAPHLQLDQHDTRQNPKSWHKDQIDKELDLYLKTDPLLHFLDQWTCTSSSLVSCIEQLWIDLYERQYMEVADVHLVQLWLRSLMEIGYNFPPMIHHRQRRDDVVLMGQYNYANALQEVLFWHQKWRKWFQRIIVRGPFSESQLQIFRAHGIDAYGGRDDAGYVSPVENLMRTVQQFRGDKTIAGVLYAHDDAIVNVPHLFQTFGTNNVLASFDIRDPRHPVHEQHKELTQKFTYRIQRDGMFVMQDGFRTNNPSEVVGHLAEWWHQQSCVESLQRINADPRSNQYRDEDGSFVVPMKGQSDFFYVPTKLGDAFYDITKLLTDYNVFLECSLPIAADKLRQFAGASIQMASLCTSWDNAQRGTTQMLEQCRSQVDVVHPFKIRTHGYQRWGHVVDTVNRNPSVA